VRLPVIRGVIDRRILANFRVDPAVLRGILPGPFRPKVHRGFGLAGLCLIRLKQVRPALVPPWLGVASENAATRFAVEWDAAGQVLQGVYVLRRDTSSRLNALAGGRIFPGVHSHGRFRSIETDADFQFFMQSDDGTTSVELEAAAVSDWPSGSIFASLQEASAFFEAGSLGYSPWADGSRYQGLELRCREWKVEPLAVRSIRSSYFDDPARFPPGSIQLDCALLMRGIAHEWHGRADLCCRQAPRPEPVEHARLGDRVSTAPGT
jgi:hypothetical protein